MWWKREDRHTDSRSDAADAAWTRNVSRNSGSLSGGCSLGGCCLLLHLPVALPQVEHLGEERNPSLPSPSSSCCPDLLSSFFLCFKGKTKEASGNATTSENVCEETSLPGPHLDVGSGVYLVHGVTWRASRLPVQVVALDEHGVVAHAAHPHVALAATLQLHAFTDVQPATGGKTRVREAHGGDVIALPG